jgi:hypothetical protein
MTAVQMTETGKPALVTFLGRTETDVLASESRKQRPVATTATPGR